MSTKDWIARVDSKLQVLRSYLEKLDQLETARRERERAAAEAVARFELQRGGWAYVGVDIDSSFAPSEPPEPTVEVVELPDREIEARLVIGRLVPEGGIDDFDEELSLREEIRRFAVAMERWTRRKDW